MTSCIILGMAICLCGCGSHPNDNFARHTEGSSTTASPGTKRDALAQNAEKVHRVTGEVRKVNREQGEVTVFHDAIPGVMGRMEMLFAVRDRSELDDMQIGDRIEAKLRIGADRSELFDISVTQPVLARAPGPAPRRVLEVGRTVPDFAMTTEDGKTLRLVDFRGDVVVMTFIYTRCPLPEFCPLMNRKFKAMASQLSVGAAARPGVRLLSVSLDPEHDTPEVLANMARLQGARPPQWTFAVASHDELRQVAEPLGLAYGPTGDQVVHNLVTAVIDARGRLVQLYEGGKWAPDDVLKVAREAARKPSPSD
jgi:protein SCO1/2